MPSLKKRRLRICLLIGTVVIIVLTVCITVPLVVKKIQNEIITTETTQQTTFTTSSTPTITTTTTSKPYIYLNNNGRLWTIVGLFNTTAGQSTGMSDESLLFHDNMPSRAMDGLLDTKYFSLAFIDRDSAVMSHLPGIGSGFFVQPSISYATLAIGLVFGTADDCPNRDPITVTLEGSNEESLARLHHGSSWTLMYNGPTGIAHAQDRKKYMSNQLFNNTVYYKSYRLLVTSLRDNNTSVQYSEARILGYQ